MLGFCISLSVLLITAFALMYLGPTVQNFLPDGGDTRKLADTSAGSDSRGVYHLHPLCIQPVLPL